MNDLESSPRTAVYSAWLQVRGPLGSEFLFHTLVRSGPIPRGGFTIGSLDVATQREALLSPDSERSHR